MAAIGSGSMYAQSAALALRNMLGVPAERWYAKVLTSLRFIYTNHNLVVERVSEENKILGFVSIRFT